MMKMLFWRLSPFINGNSDDKGGNAEGENRELLLHWCFYDDGDSNDGCCKDNEDIFDEGADCVNENIRDYC